MQILPIKNEINIPDYSQPKPSYTYYIDFNSNTILTMTDGIDAIKQAVYKILNTPRYKHIIYDRSYGIEIGDIIGKPIYYCASVIKGRIEEALYCDDRILAIEDFNCDFGKGYISVDFTVVSNFGKGSISQNFVV